jgi:hypothetical protein
MLMAILPDTRSTKCDLTWIYIHIRRPSGGLFSSVIKITDPHEKHIQPHPVDSFSW